MSFEESSPIQVVDERLLEMMMKLAEGFVFMEPTRSPTQLGTSDIGSCKSRYAEVTPEAIERYLDSVRGKHEKRYRELVATWGEENVWVGPSNVMQPDGSLLPEPAHQAFYVRPPIVLE